VQHQSSPSCSVAVRYLQALAHQDWVALTVCLSADVIRHGPFGDDFTGAAYVPFLQRTMPSLPGYRMDIDRVSELGEQRVLVELRETIELENGPLVTHECLLFAISSDGLVEEISIYIRQSPKG
jgi:SnoaL-like domain